MYELKLESKQKRIDTLEVDLDEARRVIKDLKENIDQLNDKIIGMEE